MAYRAITFSNYYGNFSLEIRAYELNKHSNCIRPYTQIRLYYIKNNILNIYRNPFINLYPQMLEACL